MSDTEPNWEGIPGGNEHRTVGSHRAWCHTDAEWCYSYREGWCHCCDATLVPEKWRGENLGVVLTELRKEVEALGHTKICSIQLHERNPYRQCTCWVQPMLNLLEGK